MGRLSDEVDKLRAEVEALTHKTPIWNGVLTDEDLAYWGELMVRWERGDDLSDANPRHVEMLDDVGPIACHVYDENAFDGTVDEWAEYYLPPRAMQARRRRFKERRNAS